MTPLLTTVYTRKYVKHLPTTMASVRRKEKGLSIVYFWTVGLGFIKAMPVYKCLRLTLISRYIDNVLISFNVHCRCVDSQQCLADRNLTLQIPGCFQNGGIDTGSTCNYCCIASSPFDRVCVDESEGVDNVDGFITATIGIAMY